MRALTYVSPGRVELADVPRPVLQAPTDALVRVTLAGICGTDLHVVRGEVPGVVPGTVIGHEFVGEIVEVGAAVQRLHPGNPVMASDFTACGHCRWCDGGDHWHCGDRAFFGTGTAFGPALAGAQAEFVRVPHADQTLGLLPAGCSAEAALLLGDNLATGWVAAERARVEAGDTVVVIGGGAVGQLSALAAQVRGAGAVIVLEPNAGRRAVAERQGSLAAPPGAARELVRRVTGGAGADVVLEAVGGNGPMDLAMTLVRPNGRIISVGVHVAEHWAFPVARAFTAEVSVGFAIGDAIRLRRRLLRLVTGGALDPTFVIDARGRLGDAPDLYRRLGQQQCLKAVLTI